MRESDWQDQAYSGGLPGRSRGAFDAPLVLSVLALMAMGCILIYDFTVVGGAVPFRDYYARRQMGYAVMGFLCMLVVSRINYRWLISCSPLLLLAAAALTAAAFFGSVRGVNVFPYLRWERPYLLFGSLGVNVGQLSEIAVMLFFAWRLSKKRKNSHGRITDLFNLLLSTWVVLFMALLLFPLNLRSALILYVTMAAILFLADAWYAAAAMAFPLFLCLVLLRIRPEVFLPFQESLAVWMNPFSDPGGEGFYAVQSIYAIADGGVWGVGLGRGTARYAVDNACTGFILPAAAQELGLAGAALILLLYLLFLSRIFRIAAGVPDRLGFYLAAAIMAHYCVNLVLCLLSWANVPIWNGSGENYLPFLSYGGSSLVLECFLMGVLLSVSRRPAGGRGMS